MTEQNSDDKGFKVTDRRIFSNEGELRKSDSIEEATKEEPANQTLNQESPPSTEKIFNEKSTPRGSLSDESPPEVLEAIDFSNFIESLATVALMHLGEIPLPEGENIAINLNMARQHIDMIGMLKEKTEGNLTTEEKKHIENRLFLLRTLFVSKAKE